jgi:hypothetical protein
VATLTDFAIPRGIRDPATALTGTAETAKGVAAWIATRMQALVELVAVRAGVGELRIGFSPLVNADGDVWWSTRLEIAAPSTAAQRRGAP